MKRKIKCLWTTCFPFDRKWHANTHIFILISYITWARTKWFVGCCVSIGCHRCAKEMAMLVPLPIVSVAITTAFASPDADAIAEKWCCCRSAVINKTNGEKIFSAMRDCIQKKVCMRNAVLSKLKSLMNLLSIFKKKEENKRSLVCVDWSGTG